MDSPTGIVLLILTAFVSALAGAAWERWWLTRPSPPPPSPTEPSMGAQEVARRLANYTSGQHPVYGNPSVRRSPAMHPAFLKAKDLGKNDAGVPLRIQEGLLRADLHIVDDAGDTDKSSGGVA